MPRLVHHFTGRMEGRRQGLPEESAEKVRSYTPAAVVSHAVDVVHVNHGRVDVGMARELLDGL